MEPAVAVPTFSLVGQASAWPVEGSQTEQARFSGTYGQRLLPTFSSRHFGDKVTPLHFAYHRMK
jgi:hypothetical protein